AQVESEPISGGHLREEKTPEAARPEPAVETPEAAPPVQGPLTPAGVIALQRTAGNAAVARLVATGSGGGAAASEDDDDTEDGDGGRVRFRPNGLTATPVARESGTA